MIIENITNDPTDAAVLSAVPCFPVPPSGVSPAIAALRQARDGHGILVGHDGLMLVLRRAWLALDQHISPPIPIHLPYGSIGANRCALRCGLIPAWIFAAIDEHFAKAAPNEAAAPGLPTLRVRLQGSFPKGCTQRPSRGCRVSRT